MTAGERRVELNAVCERMMELIVLPSSQPILLMLAGAIANYATGDPLWPLIIGAPGTGKSELISALTDAPHVFPLSTLTAQTLASGFAPARGAPPPSLLERMGSFGIVTLKDLTTLLTGHHEARGQILGQLREVADGRFDKSFGNGIEVRWSGKLGLIAGVTPVIDEQHAFLATMGERFVQYRLPEGDRRAMAFRALEMRANEADLREELKERVATFLAPYEGHGRLDTPPEWAEPLVGLADTVTRARTGVPRDGYSRTLLYRPAPEAPTRFLKQLAQLGGAALAAGATESEAWNLVKKTAWDSVPATRAEVLNLTHELGEPSIALKKLAPRLGIPERTAQRHVEDLVALGLLETTRPHNSKMYVAPSRSIMEYWSTEAAPETAEGN